MVILKQQNWRKYFPLRQHLHMSRVHSTVKFVQKMKIEHGIILLYAGFLIMHCLLYGYTNANCMPTLQVYMPASQCTPFDHSRCEVYEFLYPPTQWIFFKWTGRQTDRQTDGRTDSQKDGQSDRWTEGLTDRQTYGQTYRYLRTDGTTDRQTYGLTDGGVRTERQTNRQTRRQVQIHIDRTLKNEINKKQT